MTEPRYAVLVDVETDWPEVVFVGGFDDADAVRVLADRDDVRVAVTAVMPYAEALHSAYLRGASIRRTPSPRHPLVKCQRCRADLVYDVSQQFPKRDGQTLYCDKCGSTTHFKRPTVSP